MTSTEAMTSYSLITSSRVFPRALGTASAESTCHRGSLEVELPFHYTVGTGAQVCVCSAICVHLLPAVMGKSALWHVPAALSPCALSTLDELLNILAFSTGFLDTNPISMHNWLRFHPYQAHRFISLDTWRVVRSWDMPKPTSFC